ncbi:MAG: LysR family transcriptional regulator [Gemmataceae bacterium]|nr:LysR family transcriptional regulator [Gemmataceae bacterium]
MEFLQVFCDVARCRSFSQAAAANGLSQSAVSQIVLQLERRLGVQFVDRSTRPLQLTPLGQAYYEGCRVLIEQYRELEATVRQAQTQIDAVVQVAAIYSVGLGDMGQYVEQFVATQPQAKVHIEYLHPDRVYERVLDGTVDFGLVSYPRKMRELLVLPWRDEEMVLACAPNHPLAALKRVRPADLAGVKYIGFDRDLVIRRQVDRFLREQGVTVETTMEFDNIENIKKAIEISAGVALLPEPILRREVQAGTLAARPLAGARMVRPLGIIMHRHHKLTTTVLRFIDLLRHSDGASSPPDNDDAESAQKTRTNGAHRRSGASRRSKRTPVS